MFKRILVATMLILNTAVIAHAGGFTVPSQRLTISGSVVTNYSLTSGVAVTSDSIGVKGNVGFMTLIVTENKSGGAGDVDIYAEYSLDNSNWYRPYTSDMAGSISAEGNIVTALQNVGRWIKITPALGKHIRFIFDPDADSQITADVLYQEEF